MFLICIRIYIIEFMDRHTLVLLLVSSSSTINYFLKELNLFEDVRLLSRFDHTLLKRIDKKGRNFFQVT